MQKYTCAGSCRFTATPNVVLPGLTPRSNRSQLSPRLVVRITPPCSLPKFIPTQAYSVLGSAGSRTTPREYLMSENRLKSQSCQDAPLSALRHTPVRLEISTVPASAPPTATPCRSSRSTSPANSLLRMVQVCPPSTLLAAPPTSSAAYILLGLPASMSMPRMRIAKAICTCSGLDTVAMYDQLSPPSSLLKTSAPSVPANIMLGSLGWNRSDQTTRPSVIFIRCQRSPPSALR